MFLFCCREILRIAGPQESLEASQEYRFLSRRIFWLVIVVWALECVQLGEQRSLSFTRVLYNPSGKLDLLRHLYDTGLSRGDCWTPLDLGLNLKAPGTLTVISVPNREGLESVLLLNECCLSTNLLENTLNPERVITRS